MEAIFYESANLVLRQFNINDASFVFKLLNSPTWIRFIGDRGIYHEDEALNYLIDSPLKSYEVHGYGPCAVILKATGTPIGMCGLFKRDYLEWPDLGFAFLPEFEGKGYAYESCMATLAYVRENYEIGGLYAITNEDNVRCIRLLERCGFVEQAIISPSGGEERLVLYFVAFSF